MKTKLTTYQIGTCSECHKINSLVRIFGLLPNAHSYLCQDCLDSYSRISAFGICKKCECLLNSAKYYPSDARLQDQKTLCGFCFDLQLAEDAVWNSCPPSERKAYLKAVKKLEEKNE